MEPSVDGVLSIRSSGFAALSETTAISIYGRTLLILLSVGFHSNRCLTDLIFSNWLWSDIMNVYSFFFCFGTEDAKSPKKGNRKVQGVPQSQAAAHRRTKRNRKQTKPNKRKSNYRTKNTKISSLFPMRGNCNAKRTEKYKNKITQGKT